MGRVCVVIASIIALLVLFITVRAPTVAAQAANPQSEPCGLIDGFHGFREASGAGLVGDCLEHSRATAGGVEQRTTNRLLVWDKVLNVVAFTDGHRTWVSGPNGIETRANTHRLPWGSGRLARRLVQQVDRLTRLVDQLLDISRIESGKLSLRLEHVARERAIGRLAGRRHALGPTSPTPPP